MPIDHLFLLAVLLVVGGVGVVGFVRYLQTGEDGLRERDPKKRLPEKAIGRCRLQVEGMHNLSMRNLVEHTLNEVVGVSARADRRAGIVTVSYCREVTDGELEEAVNRADCVLKSVIRF